MHTNIQRLQRMNDTKDTAILKENADVLHDRRHKEALLNDGLISELARTSLHCKTPDVFLSNYSAVMGSDLCTPDFAKYCLAVCKAEQGPSLDDILPESHRFSGITTPHRISYQKNPYSDQVFARFCDVVGDANSVCLSTAVSVCEEVYYSRCSYCILPIYSSQDGILTPFTKMIGKYDLMIHTVCDVSMPDNDSVMRFALLSHSLALPTTDPCYVQFSTVFPSSIGVGRLLNACEILEARVTEMITYPLAYTMDDISHTIRLRVPLDNLRALLMFLHSVFDTCSFEGIFTIIQ